MCPTAVLPQAMFPVIPITRGIRSVATHRTGFAAVVRIHHDSHTARHGGFIGNILVQLGKGPFRSMPVGLPLLRTSFLASFPPGTFTNVYQVFQADDALWMAVH